MSDKRIVLKPNARPEFVGQWTVGEIRQMAQGLILWLEALPITPNDDDRTAIDEQMPMVQAAE